MPYIPIKPVLTANNNLRPDFWSFFDLPKAGEIDEIGSVLSTIPPQHESDRFTVVARFLIPIYRGSIGCIGAGMPLPRAAVMNHRTTGFRSFNLNNKMYNKLTDVKLKTGEMMEVGVIIAPDEAHAEQIKPFLAHKGGGFKWHLERSVVEPLDDLETRFYVGKVAGEIIANIMIVEHQHVGILGHVFTTPTQRRKGACKSVMQFQMEDFRQRDGEALYLGTGYNSHPYYIYNSFGFESVFPGSGFMKYRAAVDFNDRYFAKTAVHAKDVVWHDWSKMTALTGIVEGDYLRSIAFGIYGPANFEGGFLGFKQSLENGDTYHDAKLLESDSGAIVGVATVSWDTRWQPDTAVLDVFVHPRFYTSASTLLEAIDLPDAKIQCYVESNSTSKAEAIQNAGFRHEATLKNQIQHQDRGVDVLIFAHN